MAAGSLPLDGLQPRGDSGRDPGHGGICVRLSPGTLLPIFFGALYVITSAGMIAFNKYLIHEDRFPFAVALVVLHMGFSSSLTFLLYLVQPSLFPSLTDPARRVVVDRNIMLKGALPVAALFSTQLVLSNTAYLHSSVAFLQMMKEVNIVLVYALSLAFMLERFSMRSCGVLIAIIFATALTIHGEMNFSLRGFCMQGISQIFESVKIVLQAMLLSVHGKKLDALTYVLLVLPLCFVFLSSMWLFLLYLEGEGTFARNFQTPVMSDMVAWWPYLLANSLVAFALNVVIALFMKSSSAVAFILAGIVKDAMIVLAGGVLFRETITAVQTVGFTMQLALIFVWSMIKTFPEAFEHGTIAGFWVLIVGPQDKSGCTVDASSAAPRGLGEGLRPASYGATGKS